MFLHPQFPAWSVMAILCAEPGGCWLKDRMDSSICETEWDCIIGCRISVRFWCDGWRSYPIRSSVGDGACKGLSYFKTNQKWWHSGLHAGLWVRGLESTFSCGVGGIGSLGQVGLGDETTAAAATPWAVRHNEEQVLGNITLCVGSTGMTEMHH